MTFPENAGAHLPEVFEIFIGSSRRDSYGAWWDGHVVIYESFGPDFDGCEQHLLTPSRAQWERFWRSVGQIGVWQWEPRYRQTARFQPDGLTGTATQWSLALAHCGRQTSSSGNGAAPGSSDLDESVAFAALLEAVSRLLGGESFV
jgi:hypothetical protein